MGLQREISDTVLDCVGIDKMAEVLKLMAMAYPEDEKIWLQALGILTGDDPIPIDRSGKTLQTGEKVEVLAYWDLDSSWPSYVIGFDFYPSYDYTCKGIFVEGYTGSIHPSLIEIER